MSDLIDRAEVMKLLDEQCWNGMFTYFRGEHHVNCFRELVKAIPSAENKGEWIPCSERLPKERQAVLCWAESTADMLDAEFIGMLDRGDWFLQSDANHLSFPHQYNVVAWMPLPEPYIAEGEE